MNDVQQNLAVKQGDGAVRPGLVAVQGRQAVSPLSPADRAAMLRSLALRWRLDGRGETETTRADEPVSTEERVAVQAANTITLQAILLNASDVMLSCDNKGFNLRFKINGRWSRRDDLIKELGINPDNYRKLVSRFKLLSGMDISKRLVSQDGAAKLEVFDTRGQPPMQTGAYKLRAATIIDRKSSDVGDAEAMIFRLLSTAQPRELEEIVPTHVAAQIQQAMANSTGLVVVVGPTGSGKTTTLYSMLGRLNDGSVNIVTVEDPIEYEFPFGVLQTQVNRQQGVTFESFTSNVLRLAPDIILVGETRDTETCKAAMSVANTGHLVFTTVHADDSAAAIARLLDLEAEDFLVRDTVRATIAQRLVPELCSACRVPVELTYDQLKRLNPDESRDGRFQGYAKSESGCACCNQTGIQGRRGVYEVLIVNDEIRKLIVGSKDNPLEVSKIRELSRSLGMSTIAEELATLVETGAVDYRIACKTAGVQPATGVVDINALEQ